MKKLLLVAALAAAACTQPLMARIQADTLVLNNTKFTIDTVIFKHTVGPGVSYARYRIPDRPLDLFVVETDLTNPYINWEVWNGGNAAIATETPSHRYAAEDRPGHDMVVATNGDFYTTWMGKVGMSRMGLFGAGECLFNPTGACLFVMDKTNTPYIANVHFAGTLKSPDGSSVRLHTVNQLFLEWETSTADNQLSLFTPAFGAKMHESSTGGKVATIRPVAGSPTFPSNQDLAYEVVSVVDNPVSAPIPADGAVLYGVGTSADVLAALNAGDRITLRLGVSLDYLPQVTDIREAIGGSDNIVLSGGQPVWSNHQELHPRTFMGLSQDRKKIWSVIGDGRTSYSAGLGFTDEANILRWLGACDGINLDGGGSTCVVVNGKICNHNSDGAERAVGNGTIYYSTAPVDDAIARIQFEPRSYNVPITSTFLPTIYGFNQYDLLKTDDLKDVTFSCDPEIGRFDIEGQFVAASTPGTGNLYAEYNGLRASQPITLTLEPLLLSYSNYIVDNHGRYPIRMTAPVGNYVYTASAGAVDWTVADPAVASITDGYVTGIANGTTTMTGHSANFDGSVTITTEIPDGDSRPLFAGYDANEWKLTQTGGKNLTATPYETGVKLTYTGNAVARNANINLKAVNKLKTYGLPQAIELDINPGDAVITKITTVYENAHGDHGTLTLIDQQLEANKTNTIRLDFSNIFDAADNSCYPVTLSGFQLYMGVSAKDQEFTIEMPRIEQMYTGEGGVVSPLIDIDGVAEGPVRYYNLQGIEVTNPTAGQILIRQQGSHAAKIVK